MRRSIHTLPRLRPARTVLTKPQVGLGNVDNTADADKPVSSATVTYVGNMVSVHAASTATYGATGAVVVELTLTNKTLTAPAITSPTGIVKGDVGLGNVDNTSDANKPVSTAQAAANAAHARCDDRGSRCRP